MKKKIKFYLKIYGLLTVQYIKARMAYRTDFAISLLGLIMANLIGLLALWLVFQSINELAGWSYNEIVFIYAFTLLSILPFQICFENIWPLGTNLITGKFIKYYLRPLNILFYYAAEKVDVKAFGQLIFAVGLLIYASLKLDISWGLFNVALFFLLLVSSALIMIAIMLLASSLGFFVLNPLFALIFAFKLKDFAHYPIGIYNDIFKFIFTFLIPIAYVAFYPASLILRPDDAGTMAYFSPVVGIVLFLLAYKVWMKGALIYTGTGT